jgi:phosphoglycolate phosphatase
MAPLLVFDLDGTLVDSVPDLTAALNRVLAARSLAPFTPQGVAPMVGDGAGVLLKRAFAARGAEADEAAVAAYLTDYGQNFAVETRLYPGVRQALDQLQQEGWRFAVCTNKPEQPARKLLDTLGVGGFFAAIGGGDSFLTRKPDPAHLLSTIAAAGAKPAESLMLGDHANDVRAAAGAGIPCLFAGWGYGAPGMADGAVARVESFGTLPAVAERLRAGMA